MNTANVALDDDPKFERLADANTEFVRGGAKNRG